MMPLSSSDFNNYINISLVGGNNSNNISPVCTPCPLLTSTYLSSSSHSLSVHAAPFFPHIPAAYRRPNYDKCLLSSKPVQFGNSIDVNRIIAAVINCRSFHNKLPLLSLDIDSHHCDLLFLTETWFTNESYNS